MRHHSLCSILLTGCLACFAAGESDKRVDALNQAEARMLEAIRLHDADALDRLMAADYLTINADGSFADKPQTLEFTRKGGLPLKTWEVKERQLRIYGDVAVVTGFTLINGMVRLRYTEVWVWKTGRWLFASWQGTEVH
jgi:hypothetical protein